MSNIARSTLLPPYLEDSPAWADLTDSIDAVFGSKIDDPTHWLARLRDTWILTATTEGQLADSSLMIQNSDFEAVEKNILIRQANMIGFDLVDSNTMTSDQYQRMARYLAKYWYGKGTFQVQNFLGFIIDALITFTNMWSIQGLTYDTYGPLLPEGDPGIGAPIWEGGIWFPTTHIEVGIDLTNSYQGWPVGSTARLAKLVYSLANYNLVIYNIILNISIWVHSVDDPKIGIIVTACPWEEIIEEIETV